MYTVNALSFRCTLMILHLSRMCRNVNGNIYNAGKCKRYNGNGVIFFNGILFQCHGVTAMCAVWRATTGAILVISLITVSRSASALSVPWPGWAVPAGGDLGNENNR